ncbi:MAG: hypothetical protein J5678_03380 [Bacteroidaceae bacterium]|nr:hypothetical protein [Bacteroidaceae bacterium]
MKHTTLSLIAAIVLACGTSCGASAQIKKNAMVYICTGNYSKVYHLSRSCKSLTSCKGKIKEISTGEAVKNGRHLCKVCKEKASKRR